MAEAATTAHGCEIPGLLTRLTRLSIAPCLAAGKIVQPQ